MTPLGAALAAVDPDLPEALRAADAVAARLGPDLAEHSVRVGDTLARGRATYYFDQPGPVTGRALGGALRRLADALALPTPAAVARPFDDTSVLQHVLGVDAGPPVRLKRYLVFRRPDRDAVARVLDALEQPIGDLDAGRVVILGLDLSRHGLTDVKLYFRLDPRRVPPFLRRAPSLAPLLRHAREVVFGHRLRATSPRTMYFHADGPRALADELARRARTDAAARRARAYLARLSAHHPMSPWIAGVPYTDAGLAPAPLTLYLHPDRP